MNWQECAVQDLKKYRAQKNSLEIIPERITALRLRSQSAKSADPSRPRVSGGKHAGDALLDNIVERDRLKLAYNANKRLLALVDRGLSTLTENERTVLTAFYIEPAESKIDYLREALGFEQSHIYRLKDEALYHFTLAMYGVTDL